MIPETVIAVLAVGKLGAVYTPIFSGYGARRWPAAWRTARRRCSSPPTASGRRGKLVPMKAVADEALADGAQRSSGAGRPPARDGVRDVPWTRRAGRRGGTRRWRAAGGRADGSRPRPMPNDPYMIIYTSRHDRPAEGRRPRPRRLPDQGGPGPGPLLRPAARRHAVLVHRHGLDDGSLGGRRRAAARRHAGHLRGRARLSRAGSAVGAGGAAPGHPPGGQPHRGPRADGARQRAGRAPTTSRRCGCSARPASRGTPTRGGGSSARSAARGCRSSTTPAAPRSAAGSWAARPSRPIAPCSFAGPCPGMAADVVDADGQPGARRGRRAGHPPAVAGHDARLLARPRPLPRGVLGRLPGVWVHGDWARDRRGRLLVHPRPLRRHDQGGRQARRPGRGGVGGGGASGGGGGAAVGVPDEVKGEAIVVFASCVARARRTTPAAGRRDRRDRGRAAGQVVPAGGRAPRAGPAQDAQRQDHAPRGPRRVPRASTRATSRPWRIRPPSSRSALSAPRRLRPAVRRRLLPATWGPPCWPLPWPGAWALARGRHGAARGTPDPGRADRHGAAADVHAVDHVRPRRRRDQGTGHRGNSRRCPGVAAVQAWWVRRHGAAARQQPGPRPTGG